MKSKKLWKKKEGKERNFSKIKIKTLTSLRAKRIIRKNNHWKVKRKIRRKKEWK